MHTQFSGKTKPVFSVVLGGLLFLVLALPLALIGTASHQRDAAGACLPEPITTIGGVPDPKGIAVNENARLVYVASISTDSLYVIDDDDHTVDRVIPNIDSPNQVAFNPTLDRIYITNRDARTLTVLNASTYEAVAGIAVESLPYGVAVNTTTNRVYVANFSSNSVSVIDGDSNSVVKRIGIPNRPTFIAVDETANRAYVVANEVGEVHFIDGANERHLFVPAFGGSVIGIAVDPELKQLYISSVDDKVYVYDTKTRARLAVIGLDGMPKALAVNRNGHGVLAAPWYATLVHQINGNDRTYEGATTVGRGDGDGIGVSAKTNHIYVSNHLEDSVSVLLDSCAPPPLEPSTRTFGKITITADDFEEEGGRTRATGNIWLGDHLRLVGDARVEIEGDTINGWGALTGRGRMQLVGGDETVTLFKGNFSADTNTGVAKPVGKVSYDFNEVDGWALSANKAISEIYIPNDTYVEGSAELGINNGELHLSGLIDFSFTAGEDSIVESASIAVNGISFGDGETLQIGGLNAFLDGDHIGFDGNFKIRLPEGNDFDIDITDGEITKNGEISASIELPSQNFEVAGADLLIGRTTVNLGNDGLYLGPAKLVLPASLNGATLDVNGVSITPGGIEFGDVTLAPGSSLKLGGGGFDLEVNDIEVVSAHGDRAFKLTLICDVRIAIADARGNATARLTLGGAERVQGSVSDLLLDVAGMTITAQQVRIHGNGLRAGAATIGVAGQTLTVYNLVIAPDYISIGGGKFRLPDISVGDFKLIALEGEFEQDGDRYIITAGGGFSTPNLGSSGSGVGLYVSVTLSYDSQHQTVIQIKPASESTPRLVSSTRTGSSRYNQSLSPGATAGLQFERAKLKLTGIIPIGTTGLNLTSATGEVIYDPGAGSWEVSLKVEIESQGTSALSAVAEAYVISKPFEMGLGGTISVFAIEVGGAEAVIDSKGFSATLWVDMVIAEGRITVNAWSDNGFHFTGSGVFTVRVKKGALWKEWIAIPPTDFTLSEIGMDVGEFTNGKWGFRGQVCYLGFCTGVYIDTEGKITFGNVNQYKLVTRPQVQQARRAWLEQSQGLRAGAAPFGTGDFLFPADDEVQISATVTDTTDVLFSLIRSGAAPTLTLISPNADVITPQNLPDNVSYETTVVTETGGADWIQETYGISQAQSGTWQAVLHNIQDPGPDYELVLLGAQPLPVFDDVGAVSTGDLSAEINWSLSASTPVTLSVFANPGPITATLTLTDTVPVTVSRPYYAGDMLMVDGAPDTSGSQQSLSTDLSHLASGSYHIWLEADDGENAPTRVYAPDPVQITHSWADTWNAGIEVTAGYRQLDITWQANAHPDVDRYILNVDSAPFTVTWEIDTGANLNYNLHNLDHNQTYRIWIEAVDDIDPDTHLTALSEEMEGMAETAPYQIALVSPVPTLIAGESTELVFSLNSAIAPYPATIALHAFYPPEGMALTFTPPVSITQPQGESVTAAIATNEFMPGGSYILAIDAVGGGVTRRINVPVTILEPSFMLDVAPKRVALGENGQLDIAVSASSLHGASASIDLMLDAVPTGLRYQFARDSILPGEQTTLTLTDSALLGDGHYVIQIVARSGSTTRRIPIMLSVCDPCSSLYLPIMIAECDSCSTLYLPVLRQKLGVVVK